MTKCTLRIAIPTHTQIAVKCSSVSAHTKPKTRFARLYSRGRLPEITVRWSLWLILRRGRSWLQCVELSYCHRESTREKVMRASWCRVRWSTWSQTMREQGTWGTTLSSKLSLCWTQTVSSLVITGAVWVGLTLIDNGLRQVANSAPNSSPPKLWCVRPKRAGTSYFIVIIMVIRALRTYLCTAVPILSPTGWKSEYSPCYSVKITKISDLTPVILWFKRLENRQDVSWCGKNSTW